MKLDLSTHCACCGKKIDAEEQFSLPEVNAYERARALEIARNQPPAAKQPTDEELKEKYGFVYKDLFCEDCLQKLVEKAK